MGKNLSLMKVKKFYESLNLYKGESIHLKLLIQPQVIKTKKKQKHGLILNLIFFHISITCSASMQFLISKLESILSIHGI